MIRLSDWHLACEELLAGVAVDVGAEEDAPGEGFAAVGAHVGQRRSGPVLQQLGRWRLVCVVRVACTAALQVIFRGFGS